MVAVVAVCTLLTGSPGFHGGWLQAAEPVTLDRILAVVAGHVILESDVRAFMDLGLVTARRGVDAQSETNVLTYLVERRLVLDEVDRYVAAQPPPDAVAERLAIVTARFGSPDAFDAALARSGYTAEDLRQVLLDDLRREAYEAERFGLARTPDEAQRRAELIAEWVAGLVRRGQVVRPPASVR